MLKNKLPYNNSKHLNLTEIFHWICKNLSDTLEKQKTRGGIRAFFNRDFETGNSLSISVLKNISSFRFLCNTKEKSNV